MGLRKLRVTGASLWSGAISWNSSAPCRAIWGRGLDELTLTTNGSQLARFADELASHGVRRVNVSLDTLDPDRFAEITRWGRLPQVLEGIAAAKAAGLRVKINTVALKGFNEDELFRLTDWCVEEGHDLTFIGSCPWAMGDVQRLDQYWPADRPAPPSGPSA